MVKHTKTSGIPDSRDNKNKAGKPDFRMPSHNLYRLSETELCDFDKTDYPNINYELGRVHYPSTMLEKERFKEMMKKVYDAEYKYQQHRISKSQRDELIEQAEEEYDSNR